MCIWFCTLLKAFCYFRYGRIKMFSLQLPWIQLISIAATCYICIQEVPTSNLGQVNSYNVRFSSTSLVECQVITLKCTATVLFQIVTCSQFKTSFNPFGQYIISEVEPASLNGQKKSISLLERPFWDVINVYSCD